jgi:hypothetical protein
MSFLLDVDQGFAGEDKKKELLGDKVLFFGKIL